MKLHPDFSQIREDDSFHDWAEAQPKWVQDALYDNETDNYQQDHYQFHFNHEVSKNSNLHLAFHYTYGRGYYEQFREYDNFLNYYNVLYRLAYNCYEL